MWALVFQDVERLREKTAFFHGALSAVKKIE
jgi:hypothetical protein